jgi:hypothetical protein
VPSNMCTQVWGESLIVSANNVGRKRPTVRRTLGPTNLSLPILANSSAVFSLTVGTLELQNRSNRYSTAPADRNQVSYVWWGAGISGIEPEALLPGSQFGVGGWVGR